MKKGWHHTEDAKRRIREAKLGKKNPMYGKTGALNPNFGNRGKKNPLFGKHLSDEIKEKIRITKLGERNPNWKGKKATKKAGRSRARRRFKCPKGLQRHHIDGNPLNNSPENIMFVSPKKHVEIDGRAEAGRQYLSTYRKTNSNPFYGKHHSEESKAKMSAFAKTRKRINGHFARENE